MPEKSPFEGGFRGMFPPDARRSLRSGLLAAGLALLCTAGWAQTLEVPNSSFEEGQDAPSGWVLSGGDGAWTQDAADGDRAISVTGNGASGNNNYWRSGPLDFEPMTVYRLQFRARRDGGSGGCPTSGPVFCNRDLREIQDEWTEFTSVFVTPDNLQPPQAWMRFGQWEASGTIAYDDVRIVRAQPVYRMEGALVLGAGESVQGNEYLFTAPLKSPSFNHARPLAKLACGYNAPRMVFGANSELVYRHEVGQAKQTAAQLEVNIGHYSGGELGVYVSADGENWREVGAMDSVGSSSFEVPAELFPSALVWVRFAARARQQVGANLDPGSLQIHGYVYRATLDGDYGNVRGATNFVALKGADPRLDVALQSFGEALPGGDNVLTALLTNTSDSAMEVVPQLTLTAPDGKKSLALGTPTSVAAGGGEAIVELPYEVPGTGAIRAAFNLGRGTAYAAETSFHVSDLYDSSYGELLPPSNDDVGLWWASSGWKVSKTRPLPKQTGAALRIKTANNEAEAAQLVLRPARTLKDFRADAGPLFRSPNWALVGMQVDFLRVGYVPVTQPTDKTGVAALWPDPLPPLQAPVDLAANENHVFWLRVNPGRQAAGVYRGAVRLTAEDYEAIVPVEVEVFDFVLPDRMTCTTAFGFSASRAFQYHGVTTPEDKQQVFDSYLAALSAHHISPYRPDALSPLRYTWPTLDKWHGPRDDSVKHAGESALVLKDDSSEKSASAVYDDRLTIPEGGLKIRFWYKTGEPGHRFIITLLHHDASGQWMYGKNNDIRIEGTGEWQLFERTVGQFPEGAVSLQFKLWAALYAEDGSTTGKVWYDDLTVADAGTGEAIISSDFEPLKADQLDALRPEFDWEPWDAAMSKAIDGYHFNTFQLPIPGMGGGTFHARYEPNLLGYTEDTPEYKAAFTNYCQAVQEHLREKGWLDEAFVYWFDEPDPKDYGFVTNGFRKLKEAAPDIGRMLTEQVEVGLTGGPNIWCPLTPSFDIEQAEERRALGEKFWWYVCTGPKAPYATLFIDHPGIEMRVWLWQTWKRRISGLLVWETNYWTSREAYPDQPQNPYEDPMGWRTGYSTPTGTKAAWGNGDGRFLYPPEAAADGRPAAPVLDSAVDSIRLEMLRDGIEDYEYMVILDRLLQEKTGQLSQAEREQYTALLDVPVDISEDLTHFTKDPAPIERHREAVARAIEELARH